MADILGPKIRRVPVASPTVDPLASPAASRVAEPVIDVSARPVASPVVAPAPAPAFELALLVPDSGQGPQRPDRDWSQAEAVAQSVRTKLEISDEDRAQRVAKIAEQVKVPPVGVRVVSVLAAPGDTVQCGLDEHGAKSWIESAEVDRPAGPGGSFTLAVDGVVIYWLSLAQATSPGLYLAELHTPSPEARFFLEGGGLPMQSVTASQGGGCQRFVFELQTTAQITVMLRPAWGKTLTVHRFDVTKLS